jgi:hypothetical protein
MNDTSLLPVYVESRKKEKTEKFTQSRDRFFTGTTTQKNSITVIEFFENTPLLQCPVSPV